MVLDGSSVWAMKYSVFEDTGITIILRKRSVETSSIGVVSCMESEVDEVQVTRIWIAQRLVVRGFLVRVVEVEEGVLLILMGGKVEGRVINILYRRHRNTCTWRSRYVLVEVVVRDCRN